MSELEHYISSYFGISTNELVQIANLFHVEEYAKGDYLLRSQRQCTKLSFIQSGMLRIYVNESDKEVTQWISTKGYFVTDLAAFVFDTPARWNIQALSETTLYSISKENYQQIGTLVSSWHQLEKLFIAKCFIMLEDRIYSHLSMTAEQRYELFFEKNGELFNQVPLQYIASMLGMTPETLSRIRKKRMR